MAMWKCPICNWDNAEKFTACAKCSAPKLSSYQWSIIRPLRDEARQLLTEIGNHRNQASRKWEYFQVSSDDVDKYGGLNTLGGQGWELVTATSYAEGGGLGVAGYSSSSYTVKFLYLFKREILTLPSELEARWQNLINRIPHEYLDIIKKLEGIS